jgi:AcrR family transcriptional regulator
VKRDAQATRARILAAATSEFAAFGIAGARVDRIAAAAQANKNMIYIYFGSKEQLFDAIFAAAIGQLLDTVPIDVNDLPGYAGALFDHADRHPQLTRLARWHGLERPTGLLPEAAVGGTLNKFEAIAAAQAAGAVGAHLPPDQLLAMVLSIATAWSAGSPEVVDPAPTAELTASRRAAVVWAVERLTAP